MRQCKDQMEVDARQQLGLAVIEPLFFDQALAFGAVSVTARVVGISFKSTAITLFDMAAQFGCPAHGDMVHHLFVGVG